MKSKQEKKLFRLAGLIVVFLTRLRVNAQSDALRKDDPKLYCPGPNAPMNFTKFDNSKGTENGCYIVPNYVHYVRFAGEPVSYLQMICILSAFQNQKPEKIYFHYDNEETFTGKYWDILEKYDGFMDKVVLNKIEMPTEIFGQKLSESFIVFHASDITRIRMLIEYGGIFFDNDVYVVKPIHLFRRFEMALGWDNVYNVLGTQILIAHKDARFLKLWLESYRGHYIADKWYYNAGDRPSAEIMAKKPKLVHVQHYVFGNDNWAYPIYADNWKDWNKYFYTIHILVRSRKLILTEETIKKLNLPNEFDDKNIYDYNITLKEMCLAVYNPNHTHKMTFVSTVGNTESTENIDTYY